MATDSKTTELWTTELSRWLYRDGNHVTAGFMAYMSGRDPQLLLEYLGTWSAFPDSVPADLLAYLRDRVARDNGECCVSGVCDYHNAINSAVSE